MPAETEERAMLCDLTNFKSSNDQLTRIDQVLNRDQLEHFTNVLETDDATARSFYDEVHCKIATVATMNSKIFKEPTNANSGLRKEESIGNRRLFGFDGIGNESRKDMNQKINRGSMASVFNF